MDKELKLTKVSSLLPKTSYEDLIKVHLDALSPESLKGSPKILFVGGLMDDDSFIYQILTGTNTLQVIGVLEILKQYIMFDDSGE